MTVVESVPLAITLDTIQTVRRARKDDLFPELLMVPYLSSLGTQHLRDIGVQDDVDTYIMKRGTVMVDAGCDGLIVSGQAIRTCRHAFGPTLTLVSPGIRPTWAGRDDHARLTADVLISADLRGVRSHGMGRLPILVDTLERGGINKNSSYKRTGDNFTEKIYNGPRPTNFF